MEAGPSSAYSPLQPEASHVKTMRGRPRGFASHITAVRNGVMSKITAAILGVGAVGISYLALSSASAFGLLLGPLGREGMNTAIPAGALVGATGGLLATFSLNLSLALLRVRCCVDRGLMTGMTALGGFVAGAAAGGTLAYMACGLQRLCSARVASTTTMAGTESSTTEESTAQPFTFSMEHH